MRKKQVNDNPLGRVEPQSKRKARCMLQVINSINCITDCTFKMHIQDSAPLVQWLARLLANYTMTRGSGFKSHPRCHVPIEQVSSILVGYRSSTKVTNINNNIYLHRNLLANSLQKNTETLPKLKEIQYLYFHSLLFSYWFHDIFYPCIFKKDS